MNGKTGRVVILWMIICIVLLGGFSCKYDRNISKGKVNSEYAYNTIMGKSVPKEEVILKSDIQNKTYYKIEEFGGGVDNSDNSIALKKAIATLNGSNSVILFGSGTYTFLSNIVIDYPVCGVSIQGINQSCTHFKFITPNNTVTSLMEFKDNVSDFSTENITVVLGERNERVESINSLFCFNSLSESYLRNICLYNFLGGIEINHFNNIVINKVMMLHTADNKNAFGFVLGDETSYGLVIKQCSVDGGIGKGDKMTRGCCIINGGSEIYIIQNDFCNFGDGYGIYYQTNEVQNRIFLVQNDIMRETKGMTVVVNEEVSEFVSYQNHYFAYGDEQGSEWYSFWGGKGKIELFEYNNTFDTQNQQIDNEYSVAVHRMQDTAYTLNQILKFSNELASRIENRLNICKLADSIEILSEVTDKNIYRISDYVYSEEDDAGVILERILNCNPHAYIIIDKDVNMYTSCEIKQDVYCNIVGKKLLNGKYYTINYVGEESYAFVFEKNYQWGGIRNIELDCNGKSGFRFDGLLYKGGIEETNIINAYCAVDIAAFAYCYFDKIYISSGTFSTGGRLFCWDKSHASSQEWLNEFAYITDVVIDGCNVPKVVGMYNDTGTFQYINNVEIRNTEIGVYNENTSETSDNSGGLWNDCKITNCSRAFVVGVVNKYLNFGRYSGIEVTLNEKSTERFLLYVIPQSNKNLCAVKMDNVTVNGYCPETLIHDESNILKKEICSINNLRDCMGNQLLILR